MERKTKMKMKTINLILRKIAAQWEGGMDNVILGDKVKIDIQSIRISADRIDCPLLNESGECYGFTAVTFPRWMGTLGELISKVERFGDSNLLQDLRRYGVSRRVGLDKGGIERIQAERAERHCDVGNQFRTRKAESIDSALQYYFSS
jgi:hypothetical protein